jgi:hypothetical protein
MPQGRPDERYAGPYELAYAEAARALVEQQGVIDNFRTRAGMLVSGAAIATSFLGGTALTHGTNAWAWTAIGLFVLVTVEVGAVLWPRDDWEYAVSARHLIADYVETTEPVPLPLIHRDLALHMDASRLKNRGSLRRIVQHFRVAAILLMMEVLAWVGAIVSQA